MSIIDDLRDWRNRTARQEGVEPYFVLHNKTIEEIARAKPKTVDALSGIKGLGEKKIAKYGVAILAVMLGAPEAAPPSDDAVLTVGQYIARLNDALISLPARLRGEVGRINERENVIYFDFRDESGDAVLSCLIFASRYRLMGVELREGMEIVISGVPSVWPRTGRLSFRAETLELVGEGKLQQAYLALQRKLQAQGLFAPERKRPLPEYAQRVGLITSAHGDALFDFTSNLTRAGLRIDFLDCRVEGARAVPELVAALEHFNSRPLDAVVVIRGGGSWESLQAFNNEAVCRAISQSRAPVICGIGHERDVPLAALVADRFVSTPTATAVLLSQPWRDARHTVGMAAQTIQQRLHEQLARQRQDVTDRAAVVARAAQQPLLDHRQRLRLNAVRIQSGFAAALRRWPTLVLRLSSGLTTLRQRFGIYRQQLQACAQTVSRRQPAEHSRARAALNRLQQLAAARHPQRLLELGYSLVRHDGKLVRSRQQLSKGADVALQFHDGSALGTITKLTP
ncbi:MAG: exodeoxyribonuclease VII large subunit [bacterium]|nr:exodeoxyribonuclease VII large subunit [bacterium]